MSRHPHPHPHPPLHRSFSSSAIIGSTPSILPIPHHPNPTMTSSPSPPYRLTPESFTVASNIGAPSPSSSSTSTSTSTTSEQQPEMINAQTTTTPQELCLPTITVIDDHVYLFGGSYKGPAPPPPAPALGGNDAPNNNNINNAQRVTMYSSTMWKLSLGTFEWKQVTPQKYSLPSVAEPVTSRLRLQAPALQRTLSQESVSSSSTAVIEPTTTTTTTNSNKKMTIMPCPAPPGRHRHSATVYQSPTDGSIKIIYFGGSNNRGYLNDLHVFDVLTETWTSPSISGKPPAPRALHSAVIYENRLYIFGGVAGDDEASVFDDLHVLDLIHWKWLSFGPLPIRLFQRYNTRLFVMKGRLWFMGGRQPNDEPVKCKHVISVDLVDIDNLLVSNNVVGNSGNSSHGIAMQRSASLPGRDRSTFPTISSPLSTPTRQNQGLGGGIGINIPTSPLSTASTSSNAYQHHQRPVLKFYEHVEFSGEIPNTDLLSLFVEPIHDLGQSRYDADQCSKLLVFGRENNPSSSTQYTGLKCGMWVLETHNCRWHRIQLPQTGVWNQLLRTTLPLNDYELQNVGARWQDCHPLQKGAWSSFGISPSLNKMICLGSMPGVLDSGAEMIMLGERPVTPSEFPDDIPFRPLASTFTHTLIMDLEGLGILCGGSFRNPVLGSEENVNATVPVPGFQLDLAGLFDNPEYSDFVIKTNWGGSVGSSLSKFSIDNEDDHGSHSGSSGNASPRRPETRDMDMTNTLDTTMATIATADQEDKSFEYALPTPHAPNIHVHRNILCARWPHFRTLLASQMRESTTQLLELPDDYFVVKALLWYFYTDSLEAGVTSDLDRLMELMHLAHLYNLDRLVYLISHVLLTTHLCIETSATILQLSHQTHAKYLFTMTKYFVLQHFGKCVRTRAFREELAKEVILGILEEIGEGVVAEGAVVSGRKWVAMG